MFRDALGMGVRENSRACEPDCSPRTPVWGLVQGTVRLRWERCVDFSGGYAFALSCGFREMYMNEGARFSAVARFSHVL
jgi:hypothetical protein